MEFQMWTKGSLRKAEFLKWVDEVSDRYCWQGDKQRGVGVRPGYAKDYAKHQADTILIGFSEGGPSSMILAKKSATSSLIYLAVICAKPGAGAPTLKKFLSFADELHLNVSLAAMPNVLGYYGRPEFGFKFKDSCGMGSQEVDDAPIKGKIPPKKLEDIAGDPVFGQFIQHLHSRGFSVVKKGNCARKTLTASQIIEYGCENDGYMMFRCKYPLVKKQDEEKFVRDQEMKEEVDQPHSPKRVAKRQRKEPERYIPH